MLTPETMNVTALIEETKAYSTSGKINPVSNIQSSKVYIFHGSQDIVIRQVAGRNAKTMYENFGADVKGEFSISAGHGQVWLQNMTFLNSLN